MSDITPNDIAAIGDVLDLVSESSDSLTVEEAVDLHKAVQAMMSRARTAQGLLEQQMVAILESPRVFDSVLYEIVNDGSWRPDHGTIKSQVKKASVVNEDGEFRDPGDAADFAIETMYDLFIAPATFPKTGALDKLGLAKKDVGRFEEKGRKLRTTKVAE